MKFSQRLIAAVMRHYRPVCCSGVDDRTQPIEAG
jgi:hypothetical protein